MFSTSYHISINWYSCTVAAGCEVWASTVTLQEPHIVT